MFKNQGTSQPKASQYVNGDMASAWEELVELDDVQLATVVGGEELIKLTYGPDGVSGVGKSGRVYVGAELQGHSWGAFDLFLGA